MRRLLLVAFVAAAAALAAGVAWARGTGAPVEMSAGALREHFALSFSPRRLSAAKKERISLGLAARITTADGSKPQPLQTLVVDLDEEIRTDVEGIPPCSGGGRQEGRGTVGEVCSSSVVGTGSATFALAFPGQPVVEPVGHIVAYFGGTDHGAIKIMLLVDMHAPVSGAVLVPVRVELHGGQFGLRMVARVPKVAGSGSLTSLNLRLSRVFRATCGSSPLRFRTESTFVDSTVLKGGLRRPCVPLPSR